MTTKPLFSVVIPVRDDPLLDEAIQSVLDQTLTDFELIVVDDGSTPPAQVPSDRRIILKRHEQARGPGAARNTGIEAASGRFVAFLDSDDLYRPHRLATALEGHAGGSVVVVRSPRRFRAGPKRGWRLLPRPETLLNSVSPHLNATSVERSCVERFDETYLASQDIEWWIRTIEGGQSIVEINASVWVQRRGEHRRVLNGPSARLAFNYNLLVHHAGFFDRHRAARSFRWRRIAIMEREEGSFAMSRLALRKAMRARPYADAVVDMVRLVMAATGWDLRPPPIEATGSDALPPIPPNRASGWEPGRRGSIEARIRPVSALVDVIQRFTAPVPGALRNRLRGLATRGDQDRLADTSWGRFRVTDTDLLGPYCPEPLETAIVARVVEVGDVAVDIGSNLGWYTNLLAQRVGPRGHVVAVEASPRRGRSLVEQSRLNGTADRIQVIEAVVAGNSGQVRFVEGESGELDSVLGPSETTTGSTPLAEAMTFEQIAHKAPTEPTFVRIDVGGNEPIVLASIVSLLGRGVAPPILMFAVNRPTSTGSGLDRTMDLLAGRYQLFDIDTGSGRLLRLEPGSKPEGRNVIAAPHDQADRFLCRVYG